MNTTITGITALLARSFAACRQAVIIGGLSVALIGLLPGSAQAAPPRVHPVYPEGADVEIPQLNTERGDNPMYLLSTDLRCLYRDYASQAREPTGKARESVHADLRRRYGIAPNARNPMLELVLTFDSPVDAKALRPQIQRAGGTLLHTTNTMAYVAASVRSVLNLAQLPSVLFVTPIPEGRIPSPERSARRTLLNRDAPASRGEEDTGEFDHKGLTGKGVLIACVDSGVDWRHPDFIAPDGSSRLVMLWDMYDDSWEKSGGKIGSKPPANDPATQRPLGTLYTRQQITAALHGQGEVRSRDRVGHGTACLGVAAGSGKAYAGVAPEADLLVINTAPPASHGELNGRFTLLGALWAVDMAANLHRPLVVNMSYGSQDNPHDGQAPEEKLLNEVVGQGKPGIAFCASAGNEGRETLHASERFGPRRPGQRDIESPELELFVTKTSTIVGYFDHADDWGLAITGLERFLVDEAGKPVSLLVARQEDRVITKLSVSPQNLNALKERLKGAVDYDIPIKSDPKTDTLTITLPPGHYVLQGFSTSDRVTSGRFDLYATAPEMAKFASGASFERMVSSPANADGVIAVGSYDFRDSWPSMTGDRTRYQMDRGELSSYSNPGYRRDGSIKPDITAPGRYAISPLAKESLMKQEMGDSHILPDGIHLAWSGTSASSPYVAGVIALMLQKNPTLNIAQIRDILTKTAAQDHFTGTTPNPRWGYGKLNPEAALQETPTP